MNKVYDQKNNFFSYRILDEDFYKVNKYGNQITWSTRKIPNSEIDPWTTVTLLSIENANGDLGDVTAIRTTSDKLYCFQEKGFGLIAFNTRVEIPTSDNNPIEITNNYKVDGIMTINDSIGCKNKWSICPTSSGLVFVDNNSSAWVLGSEFTNLSENLGMKWWFKQHTNVWSNIENTNSGIRTFYDNKNRDIYFVPNNPDKPALVYSEQLASFTS
jgi:hypothetical protein